MNSSIDSAVAADKVWVTNHTQPKALGQQQELWSDAAFHVAVHKARNGHVVRMSSHLGALPDLWIVPEGESVSQAISAAIATRVLEK